MTDPVATWRIVVAGAIVIGLGLGLGAVALSSDAAPPRVGSTSSLVDVPPITTSAATSTTSVSSTSPTEVSSDEVRAAVSAALRAWGTFAESGDLADVDPFFDQSGPQWAVLEEEAGSVGTSFAAVIEEESLVVDGQSVTFLAHVTLVADGSENLSVEWEFELRMANDGRWLIWSVRELADG